MEEKKGGLASIKMGLVIGAGAAAAAIIAYAIMPAEPAEDVVMDEGTVVEELSAPVAEADGTVGLDADTATVTDRDAIHDDVVVADSVGVPADGELTEINEIAPARTDLDQTPIEAPSAEVQEPLDAEAAIEEATDGDVVGQEAPPPSAAFVESSGNAVTPEDTDQVTVPTAAVAPEAALIDETVVPPDPDDPVRSDTDMEIDLVVDPDAGMKSGPDPDGGAAPFYPKPSGPEGTDGNAFTTE
ncbi:hypothetical protein ACOI1H_24680 [Loktanella sp. DJP18]|uniref:hypothetical protein n=1 Tax=Loktanella sp. DJP18 TaxID=3409788 RepID=UPI003BB6750D